MPIEQQAPVVDAARLGEVAPGVWVIGDGRVPLVPNVGIVLGGHSALVVDTGMGPRNGRTVLDTARRLADGRRLVLTLTHFHPEHGYGAQAFEGEATIVYNSAQRAELEVKGQPYLSLFRGMGAAVAEALDGTTLVTPDLTYGGAGCTLDLGGRVVELRSVGPSHTRGDQIVVVPDAGVLFAGDLAEERMFPIFPWFPPEDADIDAAGWIAALRTCEALEPSVVVPGHGSVGTTAILRDVRTYMEDLRRDVGAKAARGETAEAIIAALKPAAMAAHPDWEAPEWIDFAVRTFMAQPG